MIGQRPCELIVASRIQRGKLAQGRVCLGQWTSPQLLEDQRPQVFTLSSRPGRCDHASIERDQGRHEPSVPVDVQLANEHPGGKGIGLTAAEHLIALLLGEQLDQLLDHIVEVANEAISPLPAAGRLVPCPELFLVLCGPAVLHGAKTVGIVNLR